MRGKALVRRCAGGPLLRRRCDSVPRVGPEGQSDSDWAKAGGWRSGEVGGGSARRGRRERDQFGYRLPAASMPRRAAANGPALACARYLRCFVATMVVGCGSMSTLSHGESETSMANALLKRAVQLLMWSVGRLNDRVLELTLGSRLGIRVTFAAMRRQFVPSAAEGFDGSICYELRRHNGAVIEGWGLRITPFAARASFGFPPDPAVTLKLTVGDFVRFSLGAVSPVTLLTEERLKLDGDLAVAAKLAPMFGRPLPQP